jgi:hypothetical protein
MQRGTHAARDALRRLPAGRRRLHRRSCRWGRRRRQYTPTATPSPCAPAPWPCPCHRVTELTWLHACGVGVARSGRLARGRRASKKGAGRADALAGAWWGRCRPARRALMGATGRACRCRCCCHCRRGVSEVRAWGALSRLRKVIMGGAPVAASGWDAAAWRRCSRAAWRSSGAADQGQALGYSREGGREGGSGQARASRRQHGRLAMLGWVARPPGSGQWAASGPEPKAVAQPTAAPWGLPCGTLLTAMCSAKRRRDASRWAAPSICCGAACTRNRHTYMRLKGREEQTEGAQAVVPGDPQARLGRRWMPC